MEYNTKFYYNKGLKIAIGRDFLDYYYWHLLKSPNSTLGLGKPAFSNHISVTLPRIHGKDMCEKSKIYAGESVIIRYTGEVIRGGSWFTNYWMPMECERAAEIKRIVGIKENNFRGFHLTLANTKNRIIELYPEAKKLSEEFNKGDMSIVEFRQKMIEVTQN